MNPSRDHVERRYAQAEKAFRSMMSLPNPFSPETRAIRRSPEFQAFSRRKADQMTRITRRAQRMVARAS